MNDGTADMVSQLLWSMILPTGVAALWLFIFLRRAGNTLSNQPLLSSTALFLGFVTAHYGIVGHVFPPTEALHWSHILVQATLLVFVAEDRLRFSSPVRAFLKLGLIGLLLWPFLQPLSQRIEATELFLWAGGLLAVVLVVWHLYDRATLFATSNKLTASLLGVTAGSGLTILFSGSLKIAQLHGGIGCALFVCLAFQLWKRYPAFGRTSIPVVYLALMALLGNGYFFAEVPIVSALLILLAHASVWLQELRWMREKEGWKGVLCAAAAPTVLSVVAAVVAAAVNGIPE